MPSFVRVKVNWPVSGPVSDAEASFAVTLTAICRGYHPPGICRRQEVNAPGQKDATLTWYQLYSRLSTAIILDSSLRGEVQERPSIFLSLGRGISEPGIHRDTRACPGGMRAS